MRILRSSHFVKLENLPNPRVRVGRVNSIELKFNLTITLNIIDIINKLIVKINCNDKNIEKNITIIRKTIISFSLFFFVFFYIF